MAASPGTDPTPRKRFTADERRETVVAAAIEEFAGAGLAGASTEAIARRAGVSHGYLFRLYATKRDLFVAAVAASYDHVEALFRAAADGRPPDEVMGALASVWTGRMADRRILMFHFHAYAACADDDVRAVVRRRYLGLFDWIQQASGSDDEEVRHFLAYGLLISVGAAVGSERLTPGGLGPC